MSQQFGADAVQNTGAVTLPNGTPTQAVVGNFLTPPFGNCKAKIHCSLFINFGSVPTSIRIQIFRNPTGDNTQIADTSAITTGVVASSLFAYTLDTVDPIPDGRACQYQILVTQAGTGTNGNVARSYIEVTLLSG